MAKGFKFPAPAGFAKGGMCKPKGAKGYAKGGYTSRSSDDDGYFTGADKTAPEEKISRALQEHGNTIRKINGVIHGVDPAGNVSGPIGNDVGKLKKWLGYAKGGPARGTNIEASDLYSDSDLKSVEAGRNVPMENKNRMRSESVQNAKAKADLKREYDDMYSFNPARMMKSDVAGAYTKMRKTEDETGEYAKGGKAVMSGKMKMGRKFAKMADGGEVETEQMARKATRVKMPKGAAPKGRMPRAKSVPVASRAPVIAPQQPAPMANAMMGQSPLSRVARARAPMPGAGMGMKMGGKAKKH